MFRSFEALRFFILCTVLAALAGCEGANFNEIRTDSQGNVRQVTSNNFVFADNVRLLQPDSGVEVAEIDADSLVLTGPVPPLAVGDVVVRGEGVSQFSRRVASVQQQGDRTLLTTEPVGLNDIFKEADIQETINLGPEFLSSLEPAIPGVEFGEPVQVLAQGTEVSAHRIPITFNEAVVAENGRGSVVINGEVGLRVGLRTDLQVGFRNFIIPEVRRFELTPTLTIDGNVTVKGTGSGDFRKEIPLTAPFSYPLAGFGGLGLNLQGQLLVVVDGSVQSDGTFAVNQARVDLEAGVRYQNGSWETVRKLQPTLQVTPPQLKAEANLSVSIAEPKIAVNLCDMGEVSLNAQVFKVEAEARLVTSPSPQYNVKIFQTSGMEARARLAIGITPISVRYDQSFPVLSGARTKISEIGVPLPPPNPGELFTLVVPPSGNVNQNPPLRVGEERLYFNLTIVQLGIIPFPTVLPASWSSSDPATVRLTDFGFFAIGRGLKSGQVKIRAVRPSGVTGQLDQTVSSVGLTGIQILPGLAVNAREAHTESVTGRQIMAQTALEGNKVPESGSRDLRAIGTYANGDQVDLTYALRWNASGANAQAFRNGQVNGRQQGESILRVVDPVTGRSAQMTVDVVRTPIQAMVIYPVSPSRIEITGGENVQLRVSARYADGSVREVTRFVRWESSDPFIARVNDQGLVTSQTPGQVLIKAIDPDGVAVATKRVVINQAALASLRLRPANAAPFRPGQTEQFRATAVFADGTSTSGANGVRWSVTNSSVASITESGLVTMIGPGTFRVKALMDRVSASTTEFEVNGPAGFVYITQPADVQTGVPFSVTVEARDAKNEFWTEPLAVTLELENGPANAALGGNLTLTTNNGRATFTDLTVNQVGEDYQLRAVSNGLSIALSEEFVGLTPGGTGGPLGHVFVNETTAPNGLGGLTVLEIAADGSFAEAAGSPYNTSGTASAMTKIGNFVVVAIGGSGSTKNSLQSFEYDSATGSLAAVDQTAADTLGPSSPGILKLDSGGGNLVVSLSVFDNQLKAWRVGNDGTLTLLDSEGLVGTDITQVEYYDAPGTTDYVYLSCASPRTIIAFALDSTTGTFSTVPGSPFNHIFTTPGAMETVGSNLFVVNPTANPGAGENDSMYWYTIDNATGALTLTPIFWGVGDGPAGIHAVGDLLFIGNQISANITTYRVGLTSLTSIDGGVFTPAGEVNPHSFADVALSSEESGLYVATSNSIAAYLLNTTTGILSALSGSPFGGFSSPGDIRN